MWHSVLTLLAISTAADPADRFTITLKKPDDAVAVSGDGDRSLFTITSPSGIGQAVIERKGNAWPKAVVLRLRLNGLESLKLQSGKLALGAAVSSGASEIRQWTDAGGKESELAAADPRRLELRFLDADGKAAETVRNEGTFEITLPAAIFKENPKTITIAWIDFFR